jgi:hypothetical protein
MIPLIFYYYQSTNTFISQTLKTKILDTQRLRLTDPEGIIYLQLYVMFTFGYPEDITLFIFDCGV